MIQESKLKRAGTFQLPGYQVFEKIRPDNNAGGGLLTAVDSVYRPILVETVDSVEILTIEMTLQIGKLRNINAFGPQEYAPTTKKVYFWETIENEVNKAVRSSCMILIEFDSNAKVGM